MDRSRGTQNDNDEKRCQDGIGIESGGAECFRKKSPQQQPQHRFRRPQAWLSRVFEYSRARGYQLLGYARVLDAVSTCVDTLPTERLGRVLLQVEPCHRGWVWKEAVDTAPDGTVTPKHLKETIARLMDAECEPVDPDFNPTDQLGKVQEWLDKQLLVWPPAHWGQLAQGLRSLADQIDSQSTPKRIPPGRSISESATGTTESESHVIQAGPITTRTEVFMGSGSAKDASELGR